MTFLFSLGIALAGVLPWLMLRRFGGMIASGIIGFLLAMLFVYFGTPSIAGPLYGTVGFLAIIFFVANSIIGYFASDDEDTGWWVAPAISGLLVVIYGLIMLVNSPMFAAQAYATLVPPIEQRLWKADFQPKDPRHFRVSSSENATFLASRAIGQATTLDSSGNPNAIGSQFTVNDGVSSIQLINHELWTIVPIDWSGWGPQFSPQVNGVPGYIKVSGENPLIPAEYVKLGAGHEFRYTPEAMWGNNLDRLVWNNFPEKYIADMHLEIDDQGVPHYIVSLAEPTIGWWGEKVVGALIVDPVTGAGADKLIPLGQVPSWVDRVEAEYIVHRNIDYHSKYARGFINRSIYGSNVLAATETHFGYGSNGQPVYATGITAHSTATSDNSPPSSLVAVYYTNTRTGQTVEYLLQGGATEERAIEQCNLLGDVRNKGYHGTTPQLYNVYGHISYVVPLQNASHAFVGVCIVSVMNLQTIAWGSNAYEAELAYKQVIVTNSMQMAIEGTRKLSEVVGLVTRFGQMQVSGSTTFFLQIAGVKHLFTVPAVASVKVPVTRVGDQVWLQYYDSQELVMPVNKFDNRSFALEASPSEQDVQTRAAAELDAAHDRAETGADVNAALDKLSPAERALLQGKMK